MRQPLERDRRDPDRHRDLVTEDGRGRGHSRDVRQHPRPQRQASEGLYVLAQRHLVAGSAGEVAERGWIEALLGQTLEFPHVQRLGNHLAEPNPQAFPRRLWVALRTVALKEYRRKRDPKKTPEPFGSKKRGKAPIFVVQRHDARRLHYDFRLERDGALASWAVPKGIPLEPGTRALAVHVEDHPLEYATFEGEIPKGQYGAGSVELWDTGTYELVEEKKDGGLTVRLRGERLEGTWTLVPAHLDGKEQNWLLLRKRDEGVATEDRKARFYAPMSATLVKDVPPGDDWLFEVKWDGYRAISYVTGSEVMMRSRRGNDFTEKFERVAKEIVKAMKTPDCVIDGEVCALDEAGRSSFSEMQQLKPSTPLVYYVFDLLEVEGEPLVDLPIEARRARLEELLDKRYRMVRISEFFDDGHALLKVAKDNELEGIVAKRAGSRYAVGKRTRDWLKVKTRGDQELVIAGYTKGQGRRSNSFGSLVLGYWEGKDLVYAGNVGTGFDDKEIQKLLGKLRPLERDESPFRELPKMPRSERVTWSGRSRSWWPRSCSPSGRTTGTCARRCTRGCARTKVRRRW